MPGRLLQHVLGHRRGAGVKDLVEPLLQTHVRHVVAPVDEGHILLREGVRDELFEGPGAGGGLGAGLEHRRIAARDAGGQDAQRQQDGEVEGADDQRHPIGHLIDPGGQAGKAHEAAEVTLRPGPAGKAVQYLVDLHDHGPEIAEVRLRGALIEVLVEGRLQLRLVVDDRLLELFELFLPPAHIQGGVGAEKGPLLLHDLVDGLLCVTHLNTPVGFGPAASGSRCR